MKRATLLAVAIWLGFSAQGWAAGPKGGCHKLVFNRYCLGGDITELQRRQPGILQQQREGERYALVYPEGRGRVYVMAYANRIYKVLRQYHPPTTQQYRELRDLLTGKYGMPKEESQLPDYAKGLASKIGAIRRGEGRALLIWQPGELPWRIELSWTRELGLALAYIDNQVDSSQQQLRESGY